MSITSSGSTTCSATPPVIACWSPSAAWLPASLREVDVLARWGGEEFILLLPETGLEAAAALAERLRQRVRSQSFEMGERLTASFGVGVLNDGETLDLLLCRVDDALYRAKQRRDCVACC